MKKFLAMMLSALIVLSAFSGCSDGAGKTSFVRTDKYSEAYRSTLTVESTGNAKFTYDIYLKNGEPQFIWITGPVSEEETDYEFPSVMDNVPVTGIAEGAFAYAPITRLVLPANLEYIGRRAFYDCPALTEVSLPKSVYYLGDYAFYNCMMLEKVTIPSTLNWIGGLAFKGTPWLDGQTDEFVVVGDGVLIDANVSGEVTLPKNIRYLSSAFYLNEEITRVTLPDGLLEIGAAAFMGCTALTAVNIPDSVVRIGDSAFRLCSALTALQLPDSVTEIGVYAFADMGGTVKIPSGAMTAAPPEQNEG